MSFWNIEVLKRKAEHNTAVKETIGEECPWIYGYFTGKQIRVGQILVASIPTEIPLVQEMLACLQVLNILTPGEVLPIPNLFISQSQAELDARNNVATAENEHSPFVYQLHDKNRRVNISDAHKVVARIVEAQMLKLQIKDDDELAADIATEIAKDPRCSEFTHYIKIKLGSYLVTYENELKEAQISNEKRAYKSNEQSKRCLDCIALLGDIKHIPNAEQAIAAS